MGYLVQGNNKATLYGNDAYVLGLTGVPPSIRSELMSWIILKKHGPERKFPLTDTLIDIAIAEKRPDDVIRWYDKRKPKEIGWWERGFQDNKVAER